jgi:hypothetical protein
MQQNYMKNGCSFVNCPPDATNPAVIFNIDVAKQQNWLFSGHIY